MSSIIEKLTLYDFFCYLIPGITFEALIGVAMIVISWDSCLSILEQLSDFSGYMTVAILLFGYLTGILFSEISRRISRASKKSKAKFYRRVATDSGCSSQVIYNALEKGGIICRTSTDASVTDPTDEIEGVAEDDDQKTNSNVADCDVDMASGLIEKYMCTMRGVLQSDKNFKRIHDYSSFATMCKNLAFAFIIAGVIDVAFILCMSGSFVFEVIPFAIGCVITTWIFWIRYKRFEVKTGTYVVIWYVEKELGTNEKANQQSD